MKKYLLTSTPKWNTVHGFIPPPPPPTNIKWGKKIVARSSTSTLQITWINIVATALVQCLHYCKDYDEMLSSCAHTHTHTHSHCHILNQHRTEPGLCNRENCFWLEWRFISSAVKRHRNLRGKKRTYFWLQLLPAALRTGIGIFYCFFLFLFIAANCKKQTQEIHHMTS